MNNCHSLDVLLQIQKSLYIPNAIECKDIQTEMEHHQYGALTFTLNNKLVKFRIAKITPIKEGYFVALWKRNKQGNPIPFDTSDPFSFYIIYVKNNNHCGQSIFNKKTLEKHNIISKDHKGGKHGFRLYPTWSNPKSLQAKKTQAWQTEYFLNLNNINAHPSSLTLLEVTH